MTDELAIEHCTDVWRWNVAQAPDGRFDAIARRSSCWKVWTRADTADRALQMLVGLMNLVDLDIQQAPRQ